MSLSPRLLNPAWRSAAWKVLEHPEAAFFVVVACDPPVECAARLWGDGSTRHGDMIAGFGYFVKWRKLDQNDRLLFTAFIDWPLRLHPFYS